MSGGSEQQTMAATSVSLTGAVGMAWFTAERSVTALIPWCEGDCCRFDPAPESMGRRTALLASRADCASRGTRLSPASGNGVIRQAPGVAHRHPEHAVPHSLPRH
jgi:hypothetical protein